MGKGGAARKDKKEEKQDRKKKQQESESEEDSGDQFEIEEEEMQAEIDVEQLLKEKIAQTEGNSRVALEALYTLQKKNEELEEQEEAQVEQIRQKYAKKAEALINEVNDIAEGKAKGNSLLKKSQGLSKEQIDKGLDGISIPKYWLQVFKNSELGGLIRQNDEKLLEAVSRFSMQSKKAKKNAGSVTLNFHFNKNSIVKNKDYSATFKISEEGQPSHSNSQNLDFVQKGLKNQMELFTNLSGQCANISQFFKILMDFQDAYRNSLLYYMAVVPSGGVEFGDQAFSDDEDEDEDEEEDVPKKKPKKGPPPKKSAPVEKPDCKTQ